MQLEQRARGVLYGLVIGDNLGALVEFAQPEDIAWQYPDGVREMRAGGVHKLVAGQGTDDTEMAVELLESLVERGGFDADDVLRRYTGWLESDPFDKGDTIRRALEDGDMDGKSQANGAMMRVSPLAIAYAGDAAAAQQFSRVDAALTHPNPMAAAANAVYVGALVDVLGGADPLEALRVRLGEEDLAQYLDDKARGRHYTLDNWEKEPPASGGGWVLNALHVVVYHVAQGTDFEEALVETIGLGGDTDTNAAIVGAFLGAVVGEEGIPERWRNTVDGVTTLNHGRPERYIPRVAEWADALVALSKAGSRPG